MRSIEELTEPVDLVVICVPAAAVYPAVESALAAGVRAVCVITAGFAETGPEGARAERELLALVRSYGARMIGPNCLGLASSEVRMNATFSPAGFAPGSVAVSSQSGAVGLAVLEGLERRGLGVSSFVSVGNKADVSSNDLLEHWEDDPATGTIALYLESFGNPRRFGRIARRVARRKPVIALKGGSTADRLARRPVAHRRAGGIRRRRRGPVPPVGRAARGHARGAARPDRRPGLAAAAARTQDGHPDQRRRARHPVRRCLLERRTRARGARRSTPASTSPSSCPARRPC